MNDLRQAAQQALDALEFANVNHWWGSLTIDKAIAALRTALKQQAEPVPEPVATVTVMTQGVRRDYGFQALQKLPDGVNNLYTSPQQQAEPIGWLDGNDKLAEFMHRDLKAEHDKRGSATPKDFTIPVYTAPPQRKPLTDEQLDDIAVVARKGNLHDLRIAIEAAHCIKEGT